MYDLNEVTVNNFTSRCLYTETTYDGIVYTHTDTSGHHVTTDGRQGYNNPGWRSQIRALRNAATDFTGWQTEVRQRPFQFEYINDAKKLYPHIAESKWLGKGAVRSANGIWYPVGFIPPDSSISAISEGSADNQALTALNAKIYNSITRFQGGVVIGELRETIRLLNGRGRSLFRGIDSYLRRAKRYGSSRRRNSKPRDWNRDLADMWLEYMFGWRPLINDISDAIKYAKEFAEKGPKTKIVRAVGTERENVGTTSVLILPTVPFHRYQISRFKEAKVRYIACVAMEPRSTMRARELGLAPANWLPTIWELVPYSFVVDYFTNIGGIVTSISNLSVTHKWTVKTVRKRESGKTSFIPSHHIADNVYNQWRTSIASPGGARWEKKKIVRGPYYGSLVPGLEFSLPKSSIKWLNLAALALANSDARKTFARR